MRCPVRKLALLLLILLAFAAVFSACGKKQTDAAASGQELQVTSSSEQELQVISDSEQETQAAEESGQSGEEDAATEPGLGSEEEAAAEPGQDGAEEALPEDGSYTSPEDVALYIHTYGHLPDNYITKQEAEDLGWDNREGNLDEVAPGMSIGGGRFGNYEGLLPEKKGRQYYECDVNYDGGYRGAERIVYSDDGLIYYTEDHYNSFTQLYG